MINPLILRMKSCMNSVRTITAVGENMFRFWINNEIYINKEFLF